MTFHASPSSIAYPDLGIEILILMDDSPWSDNPDLIHEHGFSLLIIADGLRILFDGGQSQAIFHNAAILGQNLGQTDMVVISHGHYDHTGGIERVLRESGATCFFHPAALNRRFSRRPEGMAEIGAPAELVHLLNDLPADKALHVTGRKVLFQNENITLGLTGPIPMGEAFEEPSNRFFLDSEGKTPDLIEDDLSLWISTPRGTILCAGCAHSGIVSTLKQTMEQTGSEEFLLVIGGFHLSDANEERLEHTLQALRGMRISRLIPCHCTGERAIERMGEEPG